MGGSLTEGSGACSAIGGAVAAIEGGVHCGLADDLDGNPVQVWHPEAQPDLPFSSTLLTLLTVYSVVI